jgi:membrane-associated phospholipid phosphatase
LAVSSDVSQFITDFADQALVLPTITLVAAWLLLAETRRALLIWIASCGVVLGGIFLLKLMLPCATGAYGLRSPSGHTASAILMSGAVLLLLAGPGRRRRTWAIGAGIAIGILVGLTRLDLGAHTVPEVIVGAAVGMSGLLLFSTADLAAPRLPSLSLIAGFCVLALLLHGTRLQAEHWIEQLSCRTTWAAPARVQAPNLSQSQLSPRSVSYRLVGTQSSPTL